MAEKLQTLTDIGEIAARAAQLHDAASAGDWSIRVFVSAPASDKAPAIETRKITPIQHRVLGSLSPEDADFIVFAKNHWPQIQQALDLAARIKSREVPDAAE